MSVKLIAKLKRPPFVHNFVRQIGESESATVKKVVQFASAKITKTYVPAQKIIIDVLRLGISKEQAVKAALLSNPVTSRAINAEFVSSFHEYADEVGILRKPTFIDDISPYRASHDVSVPVKPLAILAEQAGLVPLFAFGWASIPFSDFQFRLMMTIIEDAVFTLEDYRRSNGVFVAFPKVKNVDGVMVRTKFEWKRGDYALLSKRELQDIFDYYKSALIKAELLIAKVSTSKSKFENDDLGSELSGQGDLFQK